MTHLSKTIRLSVLSALLAFFLPLGVHAMGISPVLIVADDLATNSSTKRTIYLTRSNPAEDERGLVTVLGPAAPYIRLPNDGLVDLPKGVYNTPYDFFIEPGELGQGDYVAQIQDGPAVDAHGEAESGLRILTGAQAEIRFSIVADVAASLEMDGPVTKPAEETDHVSQPPAATAPDAAPAVSTGGGTSYAVTPPPPPPPPAAPASAAAEPAAPPDDSYATGRYVASAAWAATPTIDLDMNLLEQPLNFAARCEAGSLIKGSFAVVYYCGRDGRRYVFPTQATYFSWFTDFQAVKKLSDADLAGIPLGGNVTNRPGHRMIKLKGDARTYAVARHGALRWVPNEAVAEALYGANWREMINDVPDALFVDYRLGVPITLADAGR